MPTLINGALYGSLANMSNSRKAIYTKKLKMTVVVVEISRITTVIPAKIAEPIQAFGALSDKLYEGA